MNIEKQLYKKFSVGIAMNTTLQEFSNLLKIYGPYIDNFYGSLPLGDKYHGRPFIAQQFHNPEMQTKFWEIARMINESGINLEIVFNTDGLTGDDFRECRDKLEKEKIIVNKIAVLDWYFDLVKELFPSVEVIDSVNNMKNTLEEFREIRHDYDEIVIGRHFIRNTEVFCVVQEELHAKTVLLLNNGCSHVCGGCRTQEYCRESYVKEKDRYSSEYLYALQSIMPYELHEGFFDISHVDLFKLSTRNADTEFICKCLDSYIHNNAREYVDKSSHHYLLWSRLMWHMPYFDEFDYDRIYQLKKEICGH